MFTPAQALQGVCSRWADLDLVVARRYHHAVCALRMSTPTISIGYAAADATL
jgi:polysaccharide pyruvyl transferase WcaK-like protein